VPSHTMPEDDDKKGSPARSPRSRSRGDKKEPRKKSDDRMSKEDFEKLGNGMKESALLAEQSVQKTCGGTELSEMSLEILQIALKSGRLDFSRRGLNEDDFVKVIKTIGIMAKMKELQPQRTSVLPVTEVDFTGVPLLNESPTDPNLRAIWDAKRRAQTLQLAVQFIRVSTNAKIVKMDDCNLSGTTHDRQDLIEQEVIRLVKKFGIGSGKEIR